LRRLTLFLLLLLFAVAPAAVRGDEAPNGIDQINSRLDRTRATLDEAYKSLEDPNLSDRSLRQLRERIDPLRHELEETIDQLTPRLAAVEARLKELAPPEAKPAEAEKPAPQPASPPPAAQTKPAPLPPARPAPPKSDAKPPAAKPDAAKSQPPPPPPPPAAEEPANSAAASVNAEIADQRKLFEAIDATLKRARAMLLEARQLSVLIVARQRALFARTLFLRTSGIFSPDLWRAAIDDAPAVFSAAGDFLSDRGANFVSRVQSHKSEFAAIVVAILLLLPLAYLLSRRVIARSNAGKEPTPVRRAAVAGWTALAIASVPVAAFGALGVALEGYDLLDSSLEPIWRRLFEAVARVSFVYGLSRAVFAPTHREWRVIDPGDRLARLFVRLLTAAAVVISAARLFEQLEETVQASLPFVIVTRGLGVMTVAGLLAGALFALASRSGAATDQAVASREGRDWLAVVRFVGGLALAIIVGAAALGYVTFANFVILQAGWMAAVAVILYVVVMLASGGVEHAFSDSGILGRSLINGLGVRREQLAPIGVLLSGTVTLLAYLAAALVALAPLGYESNDLLANIRNAFFSLKVGGVTVSPSSAITALLLFFIVLAAVQGFRRWLNTRFLPLTRLDVGLRNSINATLGYAGVFIAAMISLSHIGLGVEKLAIVAGALSVGIGFGLQSIVNNFVSGLILLWERAIRVGDWVVIGDEQGYVRRINVRSTEIETFDRATMIVPNSNLVAGVVKNWLRGDRVGRIKVALAPHSGVDPEQMRDVMLAAARAQEGVLRIPAPQVMFLGMEASSFKFELWCYVEDVEKSSRVRSDLHFDLHRRLREAGIRMTAAAEPAPAMVQIPDLDKLVAAAAASALAMGSGILDLAAEQEKQEEEGSEREDEKAAV
jgi:small-conductance mechanosensitive channel